MDQRLGEGNKDLRREGLEEIRMIILFIILEF